MSKSRRSFLAGWARAGLAGLVAGLMLLLSGDGVRSAGVGIDPLEILKLQVRANVLLVLDSSGSMGETTGGVNTGGDYSFSKLYQAKQVLKTLVSANQERVSFQFGKYSQPSPGAPNPPSQTLTSLTLPATNRFLYVSTDPNAASMVVNPTGTPASPGRIKRSTGDSFTESGITHHRAFAGRFFNGHRIYSTAGGTFCGLDPTVTPANPPYLEMQLKNACADASGTGPIARFEFGGADSWSGATQATTCPGYVNLIDMPACTDIAQLDDISIPFLQNELDILGDGSIAGYSEDAAFAVNTPPNELGIRSAGSTPIANSLTDFKPIFDNLWFNGTANVPAISTQTPVKQRTFAIVVTDGDDTCGSTTTTDNTTLVDTDNERALRAAYRAELLHNRIVPTDPASGVPSFIVAFGLGAAPARANWEAWGGSGMSLPTVGTGSTQRWDVSPTPAQRAACTTCQDAFIAPTAQDLADALQQAIDLAIGQGEFSASQSIIGTVFELTVDDPATTSITESALDPDTRYNQRVNILYQSTFELPGWKGHLGAFRNDGSFQTVPGVNSLGIWDAGQTLFDQVSVPMRTAQRGSRPPNQFTFAELHDGQSAMTIAGSNALIKRRIFTSVQNGTFERPAIGAATYDPQFDASLSLGRNAVALWPPNQTGLTSGITEIDPPVGTSGPFDAAFGISTLTLAELKSFFGACEASGDATSGPLPAGCSSTPTALKEARQILLAYMAGASIALGSDGLVLREQTSGEILFQERGWLLGDTTLSAVAVVGPPLKVPPAQHTAEFVLFRDGFRDPSTALGVNDIDRGFGLRNPDGDDPNPQSNATLKPVMTVVYLGANDMLHAFRAGPECAGFGCEQGSEELWSFLPYDQLGKQMSLMAGQVTDPHTYVVASSLRVSSIFIPDADGFTSQSTGRTFTGRWRTALFFGRGPGGKYYTALDVTSPGPFTRKALLTNPPWVMWSRGNPDTVDGTPAGTPVNAADTAAYSKMGETWSIPALGNVDPALGFEWRAFTGSGYGDPANPGEGSTFYHLDAITGNVIRSHDLPGGLTTYIDSNALVAGPSAYNPRALDPPNSTTHDIDRVTRVYIPDVQGRIWKFTTSTSDLFFDAGPSQPFGNSVALLKVNGKAQVYAEAGNDPRVPETAAPFKMFGLRDEGSDTTFLPTTLLFALDFPATPPSNIFYRGTVQPATAFNDATPAQPRVFFAGTRFNRAGISACISSFDTIFFAVGAVSGGAVYDFNSDGVADLYDEFEHNKTTGIQPAGGSIYMGQSGSLGARPSPTPDPNPTPTPAPPSAPYVVTKALRSGSPVCRTP
jgi:hypothetical protein